MVKFKRLLIQQFSLNLKVESNNDRTFDGASVSKIAGSSTKNSEANGCVLRCSTKVETCLCPSSLLSHKHISWPRKHKTICKASATLTTNVTNSNNCRSQRSTPIMIATPIRKGCSDFGHEKLAGASGGCPGENASRAIHPRHVSDLNLANASQSALLNPDFHAFSNTIK